MANEYRFFIVGQDKSKDAADRVEARYSKLGKRLDMVGRTMDRLGIRTPFGQFGRSFDDLGKAAGGAVQSLAAGEEEIGGVAAIAGEAIPIIGALAIATGAAAGAAVKLGVDYGNAGAEIERTARRIGDSTTDLQRWRGAAAYAGVSAGAMTSALDGVGNAMQEAVRSGNQPLLALMSAWGIQVHHLKDGSVDTTRAMLDIARAMDRIHGAQSKRKFAEMFGVGDALPLLMQGSKAVADNLKRFDATGALRSDATQDFANKLQDLHNRWTALTNDIARPIEAKILSPGIDVLIGGLTKLDVGVKGIEEDISRLIHGFDSLDHVLENFAGLAVRAATSLLPTSWLPKGWLGHTSPSDAAKWTRQHVAHMFGDHSQDGPPAKPKPKGNGWAGQAMDWLGQAGSWAGKTFGDFAGQIEHQESRGRQFDRQGQPLTSDAGAVGVMQLEPATAREAAQRMGVPFDERRLRTDAAYNRMLGQEQLRFLLQRFGGDLTLTAAAYNAGPGDVDRWIRRYGDPRKDEISDADFAAEIPKRETRNYVQAFVDAPPIDLPGLTPPPAVVTAPQAPPSPQALTARAERVGSQVVTVAEVRGVLERPQPQPQPRPAPPALTPPATPAASSAASAPPWSWDQPAASASQAPRPLEALERPSYARAVAPAAPAAPTAPVVPTPVADVDPNGVRVDPQLVKVDISLKGAPRGTVARVHAPPSVAASIRIERALDLESAA